MNATTNNVIKAMVGERIEDFVIDKISNQRVGTFQFQDYVFHLNGTEDYKDFCLIMSKFYLEKAMQ